MFNVSIVYPSYMGEGWVKPIQKLCESRGEIIYLFSIIYVFVQYSLIRLPDIAMVQKENVPYLDILELRLHKLDRWYMRYLNKDEMSSNIADMTLN